MRLREVFRYELEYRLRAPSTWTYAVFLFLVMFWGLAATGDGGGAAAANAPQKLAQGLVLFGGTFGILVSAALFADAAIRDAAAGMEPLLYTTRLRKDEYLGGRYLAALAINAIVVLALPLGFFIATKTIVEADAVGPFRLAAYLQPLLLFVLPNLVLVGAVLFTIGVLARQVIPVYLGAAGIFIGYIVAANYWSGIESPTLSALADPLGINALLAMTRYWTPSEVGSQLIGFPPMLLWNRVLWLAIAAGVLGLLHRRFRFAHADGGRRENARQALGETLSTLSLPVEVPKVVAVFDGRTALRQTLGIARQSLAEVMAGRSFAVAFVGTVGLVLLWGWNVGDTVFETSTWPVTHLVIAKALSERSVVIPFLLIAVYAGELVWKDREVGAAEIADAAPLSTSAALGGRFLALVAIIVVFHVALMIGGLLIQGLQGYYTFEPGLYLRALFGLNLASHILLGALAITVHVVVNQKYVGHILVFAASVLGMLAGPMELPYLAVYNGGPRWTYSDLNGFGPSLEPFLWFKLYWACWAMLLGVVAVMFWVRGREASLVSRIAAARARLNGPVARTAAVATVLIVAVGGFIFYNTNILNASPAPVEAGRTRAEYERRYARFEESPQPVITAADLRIEVYPDEPAADMRGTYRLVNRSGVAVDSVHVVTMPEIETRSVSVDRAARAALVDEEGGYRILALDRPLAPGDSLLVSFDVVFRPRGFRSRGIQTEVVENGSYIDRSWLPFIGYQPAFELTDASGRKRFGLAPKPSLPGPHDVEARQHDDQIRNEDRVQFELVVGTAEDQIAVVSGALRREWTENARRYFHYGSDLPTTFGGSVLSARYAVHDDRWDGVALRILHHPDHGHNLAPMTRGMKASLDYYTTTFGPYQYRELRIAEIPPYGIRGRALATTIIFAEDFFITRSKEGRFDQAFFGTAHEVAHSWWGGQVRGAHVRGRGMLSETLANYSAMMVTEKTFGPDAVRQVYDYQMDRYLSRRAAFARDVPLLEVEDHPHISYGKGAVAMYTLREHLGEAPVNGVLRRFIEKHGGGEPPYPTTLDLLADLRAVTPDSVQYLLTDLFETVTLWDVETRRATVARTDGGRYEVTLDVVARKVRADSVGRETETPMDDLVEIGVFAAGEGDGLGAPLYLQRHRIRSGRQTIRVTVPREPARAGIDPNRKLIDRARDDNVVGVKPAGASPDEGRQ